MISDTPELFVEVFYKKKQALKLVLEQSGSESMVTVLEGEIVLDFGINLVGLDIEINHRHVAEFNGFFHERESLFHKREVVKTDYAVEALEFGQRRRNLIGYARAGVVHIKLRGHEA